MFGYKKNIYAFLKRENTRMLSKRIPNCYNYTLADASKCFPNCYTNLKKVIKFVKGIKHFIINF